MSIDLNEMSLKELRDLHGQVTKAIANYQDRRKQAALAVLEEKAKDLGFSLAQLTGAKPGRKRSIGVPKYANPIDPSDTWSGRGRKPKWFLDALAEGKTPEDLAL
ncbi:MAG: H-NS family nucleoid-associated regulatory protein [Pseudorhodobacter sp.]